MSTPEPVTAAMPAYREGRAGGCLRASIERRADGRCGMTETAPTCTFAVGADVRSGHIGLPVPRLEVKLVPMGEGKTKIRFRGPNVMSGYWRSPQQSAVAAADEMLCHPAVREFFQVLIDRLWRAGSGSASRIERAPVLDEPSSVDHGEITDKGTIDQRAVLTRRAALVDTLYADREARAIRPHRS